MPCARPLLRLPASTIKVAAKPTSVTIPFKATKSTLPHLQTRNMSFFPAVGGGDFTPLFRLLDDYDSHRTGSSRSASIQSFQPKFDVREIKEAYELHGELPGLAQKDVSIEFSDPTTLVVKGRTERESVSGTPPAVEGTTAAGRITSAAEEDHHNGHKTTVEDDPSETPAATTDPAQTQVETHDGSKKVAHHKQPHTHKAKYWVAERSVGEFQRSFTFPARVDQDNVKASLKNGILSIVVPKATAQQSRKITIE